MNDTASTFISMGIQEWGQPEAVRIAAVQDVLDAAGFKATATCSPVFGGIWKSPCTGPDADAATAWLSNLTKTMPRGKFEREAEHVERMIGEHRKAA